jgi:hypothetical protein
MPRLKWKLDSVHLEIVLTFTQDRCTICVERTRGLENRFVRIGWNYYVTWVMWNLISVRSEIVLLLVQDRGTVCAKRLQAQKLFWTHLMVLLGEKALDAR